jgi:hypothetical protein
MNSHLQTGSDFPTIRIRDGLAANSMTRHPGSPQDQKAARRTPGRFPADGKNSAALAFQHRA